MQQVRHHSDCVPELTAVAAFIYYFLFLTVLGATVVGLFNISRSQRVSQYSRPEVERNVTATEKERRLYMVVPKTKHRSPAKKAANSAAASAEKADVEKSRHHRSRAGFSGGY
jgi:hypothetical protein